MAQYDIEVRHAKLRAIVQSIGPKPVIEIRTGEKPSSCQAPPVGTLLARIALGEKWMGEPAGGRIKMSGSWEGPAIESGDAGHFRILSAAGACRIHGTIGTAGTDMLVNGVGCIKGQVFVVNSFSISDNNG